MRVLKVGVLGLKFCNLNRRFFLRISSVKKASVALFPVSLPTHDGLRPNKSVGQQALFLSTWKKMPPVKFIGFPFLINRDSTWKNLKKRRWKYECPRACKILNLIREKNSKKVLRKPGTWPGNFEKSAREKRFYTREKIKKMAKKHVSRVLLILTGKKTLLAING